MGHGSGMDSNLRLGWALAAMVCVCVCVSVCARAHTCVWACVRAACRLGSKSEHYKSVD